MCPSARLVEGAADENNGIVYRKKSGPTGAVGEDEPLRSSEIFRLGRHVELRPWKASGAKWTGACATLLAV